MWESRWQQLPVKEIVGSRTSIYDKNDWRAVEASNIAIAAGIRHSLTTSYDREVVLDIQEPPMETFLNFKRGYIESRPREALLLFLHLYGIEDEDTFTETDRIYALLLRWCRDIKLDMNYVPSRNKITRTYELIGFEKSRNANRIGLIGIKFKYDGEPIQTKTF